MTTTHPTSRIRRVGLRTTVLALALVALGSSPARAQMEAPASSAPKPAVRRDNRAELQVENNNWLDAHLYLVRDGMLTSLGFMNGPGEEHFTLPSMATMAGADIQVLALPIGGTGAYLSPVLVISPGDKVKMTIQNNLALSSVAVEPKG